MKILARITSLLILISLTVLYIGCGDKNKSKPVEEQQLDKLKIAWNLTSAKLDGVDRTSDFPGLILTLTGTYGSGTYGYSFTGTRPTPSPWPANGTWQFGADPVTQLLRLDDNLGINYSLANNDAQLTITFTYAGAGFPGGRVTQVSGNWEFIFSK